MSAIAFLVEQTAPALYIFIGLGVLIYLRRWLIAHREYRATTFELERDYAREQRSGALFALVILMEIGVGVVGMQQVVAPTVREDMRVAAAVAQAEVPQEEQSGGTFATSTPPAELEPPSIDSSGVELGESDDMDVFVTPTLTPTPVGTIEPNAPEPVGCNTDNAFLRKPVSGMRVLGIIDVLGTAYWEDFSSYKLEISGPETLNQFVVFDTSVMPVEEDGVLSQFDPDPYEPGTYDFRLTVFDTSATMVASCQVTIYIARPEPTATPLAEPTAAP